MDRGKVLWEKDLEELKGNWARYLDKDGDGIPYRTFPGNKSPASSYFLRGTGHDEYAKYSEEAPMWYRNMERLKNKYEGAKKYVPAPIMHKVKGASVGIIGFGSTEAAILEAQHQLNTQNGIQADFMRVRAVPFTSEVADFIKKYDQVFVVEMNRNGQMNELLEIEYPEYSTKLKSVAFGDGLPASAKWVREGILAKYKSAKKPQKAKAKAVKSKTTKTLKKNTSAKRR